MASSRNGGCIVFYFVSLAYFVQKREKRRWIFRKPTNIQETIVSQSVQQSQTPDQQKQNGEDQKHALAVAVATAEAAMATAQTAAEVARLTRPSNHASERTAAIVIQTAFRGYLVSQ